jgi:hypothetical protein
MWLRVLDMRIWEFATNSLARIMGTSMLLELTIGTDVNASVDRRRGINCVWCDAIRGCAHVEATLSFGKSGE